MFSIKSGVEMTGRNTVISISSDEKSKPSRRFVMQTYFLPVLSKSIYFCEYLQYLWKSVNVITSYLLSIILISSLRED